MPRVAVIGAGTAGIEAARVASSNGARVDVLEAGDRVPSPKSTWAGLLESGSPRRGSRTSSTIHTEVDVQLNQPVSKVSGDLSVIAGGRRIEYDAVVLSTGSRAVPERLEGIRKSGVHVLDSEAAFARLGRELDGYRRALVAGTGPVAVKVAEKLRSRRLAVSILAPGGVLPLLNAAPRRVVSEALSSWGIDVMDAGPERIVGVDRVEAVVAAGEVVPADCIAIVPRFAPCVPQLPVGLGRSGGVVVDEMGRSSLRSLYAAGDCAEVRAGNTTIPVMFESSAKLMGAVSGANASGAHASGPVVGSFFMELAGIGVASAGVGVADSTGLGLEPGESSMTWKGDLACSLVYDARSKTVLGVQLAGKGVASLAETLPIIVASRMTVNQLAYLESLSSGDVSPIKETARTGAARQ